MIVQIEEFLHRTVFAFDELDVVDNQQVVLLVLLLEYVIGIVANRLHKAADIVVRMHIAHFRIGTVFQQLVTDGLNQVGFTQTRTAIEEKRVITLSRTFRYRLRGGSCKAVALTFYQRIKRVIRRQVGSFVTRLFRITLRIRPRFLKHLRFRTGSRFGSMARLMREVFHTFRQNIRRRFRLYGFGRPFRRHFIRQLRLHRQFIPHLVHGRFFYNPDIRHLIAYAFAGFEYECGTVRHQFLHHRLDFPSKLALKHIAGKLVFTVHHPHFPFFTDRKGRNPLRKLPRRQHIAKAAEAHRPELC